MLLGLLGLLSCPDQLFRSFLPLSCLLRLDFWRVPTSIFIHLQSPQYEWVFWKILGPRWDEGHTLRDEARLLWFYRCSKTNIIISFAEKKYYLIYDRLIARVLFSTFDHVMKGRYYLRESLGEVADHNNLGCSR